MRFTGGMLRLQLTGSEGRAGRHARDGVALVVGARGGAVQVHLDVQVGDVLLLDGDLQGGRAVRDREALVVDDPAAVDRQQAFGRAEGRLDQDVGDVARLVVLLIRDQGELLLLHVAGGRQLAAAHPAGEPASGSCGPGRR